MDYLYENLGDERFQEFCSCLISKEFENIQAFPVGQPDGGRDSLVYFMDTPKKDFIVFQVKFVRSPNTQKDAHKWLIDTIDGEINKIIKLIPRGAKKYYLLTNVKGTAHLSVGSKDQLNKILEDKISIPSICWWRDDLSRLFEKDPIFKWSFPEILNGQDILNSALFNNLNENKERRESVVTAYLSDQYSIDHEVKFKQIDLQNRLFDLFTDVPIKIKKFDKKNRLLRRTLDILSPGLINEDMRLYLEEPESIGAASFLLNSHVQNNIEHMLLEGGPGQGKSTITQYICQVHRARLLKKESDLNIIQEAHRKTPVRLPFKIDLRHIAFWVEKKNPYPETISEEIFSKIWAKSLESFLVGHLIYHSQINDFMASDLVAICKLSPVLFVFDGFDEIANFEVREEVIDFINKGINRLSDNSQSIQVIVTSRPAAFSDSIGFPVVKYPHFELSDITPELTKDYLGKWIKASRLDSRESAQIRKLVEEKLKLPHLRELAKSPMQLAIFISLLRTRGESLPNKRTALFDSYIELFFNREAEKSHTVRDYRDLIIDIHKYLAWILHSEAELYKNSGTIQTDILKSRLNEYLKREGHQTDITNNLFKAVEERVCALVSRVQGTFEFEVQPLREYFCAKYLYETAPYSPVGTEKSGTKPDRFDAISRNFYWQNVMRFFAGCFDKGELPMLIQKIKELQDDEILQYTDYTRVITSQLLSDYVFTQYPLYLKDVVKIIIDGINIGTIINQKSTRFKEPILLPLECGRTEVVNECFNQLKKFPPSDYASELIAIIVNNPYNTLECWQEHSYKISAGKLTTWLEYAYQLEIIHKIDKNHLLHVLKEDSSEIIKRLQVLLDGERTDVVDDDIEIKQIAFQGILDGRISMMIFRNKNHSFQALTFVLHPILFRLTLDNERKETSFLNNISRYVHPFSDKTKITDININDDIDQTIMDFLVAITDVITSESMEWKHSLLPWDNMIENGRLFFKDCWLLNLASVISAGIKAKNELYESFYDLDDSNVSLSKRVRCARMKSGNINFWRQQLSETKNMDLTMLVFLTWATPKAIFKLIEIVSVNLDSLSQSDYSQIVQGLKQISHVSEYTKGQQRQVKDFIENSNVSNAVKFLISFRFPENVQVKFVFKNIDGSHHEIEDLQKLKLRYLIDEFATNNYSDSLLEEIKKAYLNIKNDNSEIHYLNRRTEATIKIPIEMARNIMVDCKNYPKYIASLAERTCRAYAHKMATPVGEIAKKEKWFET